MATESTQPDAKWRERARHALEQYFRKRSAPRLILSLLLILTGAASLGISIALLHVGLSAMWLRYPIAVLSGYAVFIGLLRFWLEFERSRFNPAAGEIENAVATATPSNRSAKSEQHRGSWLDWLDFPGLDLDEGGCLVALLIGVVFALIGLAVFAVLSAQAFIAEVFLDGFIISVLYRRLRIAAQEHWLGTAVRRTWWLALLTAALLAVVGWCLETLAPGARSIGPALERVLGTQNSPQP